MIRNGFIKQEKLNIKSNKKTFKDCLDILNPVKKKMDMEAKIQELAQTLKNNGLAASMEDALEAARRIFSDSAKKPVHHDMKPETQKKIAEPEVHNSDIIAPTQNETVPEDTVNQAEADIIDSEKSLKELMEEDSQEIYNDEQVASPVLDSSFEPEKPEPNKQTVDNEDDEFMVKTEDEISPSERIIAPSSIDQSDDELDSHSEPAFEDDHPVLQDDQDIQDTEDTEFKDTIRETETSSPEEPNLDQSSDLMHEPDEQLVQEQMHDDFHSKSIEDLPVSDESDQDVFEETEPLPESEVEEPIKSLDEIPEDPSHGMDAPPLQDHDQQEETTLDQTPDTTDYPEGSSGVTEETFSVPIQEAESEFEDSIDEPGLEEESDLQEPKVPSPEPTYEPEVEEPIPPVEEISQEPSPEISEPYPDSEEQTQETDIFAKQAYDQQETTLDQTPDTTDYSEDTADEPNVGTAQEAAEPQDEFIVDTNANIQEEPSKPMNEQQDKSTEPETHAVDNPHKDEIVPEIPPPQESLQVPEVEEPTQPAPHPDEQSLSTQDVPSQIDPAPKPLKPVSDPQEQPTEAPKQDEEPKKKHIDLSEIFNFGKRH